MVHLPETWTESSNSGKRSLFAGRVFPSESFGNFDEGVSVLRLKLTYTA